MLKPYSTFHLDELRVDAYIPEKLQNGGICLILGLMIAVYQGPYHFEYLIIRGQEKDKLQQNKISEPLLIKDSQKLILKEICDEVQKSMDKVGSVYVQMDAHGEKIGVMLWNLSEEEKHTCSVAYQANNEQENQVQGYLNQVYKAFLDNEDVLVDKVKSLEK